MLYFRIRVTRNNTEESRVIQDVVNVQLDMYRYDIQLCDMHHGQYMYVYECGTCKCIHASIHKQNDIYTLFQL